jgi:hypothetical protein
MGSLPELVMFQGGGLHLAFVYRVCDVLGHIKEETKKV